MKKSLALQTGATSLEKRKDSTEGILIRLVAAIMEHRYDSLDSIFGDLVSKKDVDVKAVCLCVLGMMHVVNAKPINTAKIILEIGKRFELYEKDIRTNRDVRKLDLKYFHLSFDQIIDTFVYKSLNTYLEDRSKDLVKKLLDMVNTGGLGRSYRFNLNGNLPNLMDVVKKVESYILDLDELPVTNRNERILNLAYAFLDEGKFQILVEERFFQPTSPTVSTTVIWHNYVFLRDNLFGLNNHLMDKKVLDACNRRNAVWNYIQRFMTSVYLEKQGTWYLADIRRRFPKPKLIACAAVLDGLLKTEPTATLEKISKCIEVSLAKKK